MLFRSKVAVTTEQAQQEVGGTSGIGGTIGGLTDPNPKVVSNFALADLIKRQTAEGKITWKRSKGFNRYDRTYTSNVSGYELTATADRVTFRDKNSLGSKTTTLSVSGILGTIERVVVTDPVAEFEEALAAL